MKLSRESIFISAIRSFFNTLLGTLGIFLAFIAIFIIFSFFLMPDQREAFKNKFEILPDLNGNTKLLAMTSPAILQIDIHGVIGGGNSPVTSQNIHYQLIESRKGLLRNNRVKGILLHINSPGGTAIDSDSIFRNLITYKKKYNIPIYAYVDGICASGGFYIACACDKILASPLSIIGSVGSMLGPFFNVSKALEKYGVDTSTLTEGKNKDVMNPFRPWEKDEEKVLSNLNEAVYSRFVSIVASSRNLSKEKITNEYGARIFNSEAAKKIGYIDEANNSYQEALEEILKKAEIDTSKNYQIVSLTPQKKWLQPIVAQSKSFFENLIKEFFLSSKYKTTLKANNPYND